MKSNYRIYNVELAELMYDDWLDNAMPSRVKSAHNRKRERDYKRKEVKREHVRTTV